MEATKEDLNILYKIRPPRLEDAGLEDCALPAESIKEAFLKAATAVGSRAASIFATEEGEEEEDGRRDCINDSWPSGKFPSSASDVLVGFAPEEMDPPESCEAKKGPALIGEGEFGKDVVSGGRNEEDVVKKDEVLVGGDGGGDRGEGGDCVDGLKGLKIGEKKGNDRGKEKKQPTLVEGYF